ncbi:hypothetical protein PPYR_09291 [Photinus pyralis]|uniref:ribonuclease III n=1 Tax=Photinus pyralis TaxID=7054 RepID=A0A1Y1LQY7_PHOPY|nr:endoribonuclease Dcr-1 [Photinus pyralis]KAB0798298.1 hypothetical protein PPYR_09291 [Photinus pyralis]
MACHFIENVYTQIFTPREHQVELLQAAKERNTIVCSGTSTTKTFIAVKLLQELAWQMRSPTGKRALFILDPLNVNVMTSHIRLLTDLSVKDLNECVFDEEVWIKILSTHSVIITTIDICTELLQFDYLDLDILNLIVIDDCLYGERQELLSVLMHRYRKLNTCDKPRILGLAGSLLGPDLRPECLEDELQRLENLLCSSVNTSSELVTLLRFCCRPQERLVECASMGQVSPLQQNLEKIALEALEFMDDHRFAPTEIYTDETYLAELLAMPDPKSKPKEMLLEFLDVLRDLGPWAADQAAYSMISLIERLKVKVPYERHYLLLLMVFTVLIRVRATCDDEFQGLSEMEKVYRYSSPKVLRLLEILKEFKPAGEKPKESVVNVEGQPAPANNVKTNRGKNVRGARRPYIPRPPLEDNLCALVFVQNRITAKVIFTLLKTMQLNDPDYWWLSSLYSVEKVADPVKEPHDAELEHLIQEEVLRKYRTHDCNIMVATSILEQGCDLPKCNLVIRFDIPTSFHSYVQSKARARAADAHYLIIVTEHERTQFVTQLAEYLEVEKTLLRRCYGSEPNETDEIEADRHSISSPVYKPSIEADAPSVTYSTAITLVNRYCAKLPSDTFTRLTTLWDVSEDDGFYTCNLRLPINSPVKQKIVGLSAVSPLLACRDAAFKTCKLLHETGELDNSLQPISKENFRANEEDWNNLILEEVDEVITKENLEPRPGTTKRRQYYYKRIAESLMSCLPSSKTTSYFYKIVMTLTCPLPEEQNTRGRRIYPPEESVQGFGILTSKPIPKICPFPIFTRSGEVSVDLELCSDALEMTQEQIEKICEFLNYTFTSVLRLQRYLMLFNPIASDNCFLIAPTRDGEKGTTVDWDFVDLIYKNRDVLPQIIPEEERVNYQFDPSQYKDAVVMPWYRNQDQPQYFYVAEICGSLNPESSFPGSEYATFREYYFRKYGITIQNSEQHLLDVDHTSARLNFLTPRYVNRKGVALPTSSEETKRAKRENLEQKQILVPELCAIHPFPASLWRKAVCLPCILYRINALLLADQIRRIVALELDLGKVELQNSFRWPPLNFGWNLSDVFKKTKEQTVKVEPSNETEVVDEPPVCVNGKCVPEVGSNHAEEDSGCSESDEESKLWVEIGTWSNDMAGCNGCVDGTVIRYSSPTSWIHTTYDDFSDSDESSFVDDASNSDCGGLRIEFMGDNTAEAVESDKVGVDDGGLVMTDHWTSISNSERSEELKVQFQAACSENSQYLLSDKVLVSKDVSFTKSAKQIEETFNAQMYSSMAHHIRHKSKQMAVASQPTSQVPTIASQVANEELAFSFDKQPDLAQHPGPSPSVILQALTMSNANDGINLERLETIGDSHLKYAITTFLYSKYDNVHEGKLSHLRSKQVSNLNLYRLGKRKALGECMIATKFDPHDNWLPPCYYVPKELEEALIIARVPANYWSPAHLAAARDMTLEQICQMVREHGETLEDLPSVIPYNLVTQHSIPDKSIADCVEALIGAYLIDCGPRGALLFMAWLGMKVLPQQADGSYGELEPPKTPLLRNIPNPETELSILLDGYHLFEDSIGYHFTDRSYLLQALTHASYFPNALTDCYQRLEFLGDAVLDYVITRHLYEDPRMHSPGALTDLRSALVNNTIFASLAVRHGFHRYFRHLSPALHEVIERFVRIQEESGHALVEDLYLLAEYECEEVEDVEVPKALGDVFESVAGAIFLDSGMSLDAVWRVYYRMMKNEIEKFSDHVPKSPIRELLELEPETAKFGKPEKLADGRRVRVSVEVFGKGLFKGIGRNYRIAKCTAAKCALKHLKRKCSIRKN